MTRQGRIRNGHDLRRVCTTHRVEATLPDRSWCWRSSAVILNVCRYQRENALVAEKPSNEATSFSGLLPSST